MSDTATPSPLLLDLTTGIVSAYLANHHLPPGDVPGLVGAIYGALSGLGAADGAIGASEAPEPPTAAEIRKSIRPDGLISFIDGKAYKTLRRHLTVHGLDPDSYRARYKLPSDYPMVASSYSAKRSELAKALGLGQRPTAQAAE